MEAPAAAVPAPAPADAAKKAQVTADVGLAQFKAGETQKAVVFFEKALAMISEETSNPLVVTLLLNLGVAETILQNYVKSGEHLERALAIQEKELGAEHEDVVATLQNLIVVQSKLGEVGKAVEFMERAGKIKDKVAKATQAEAGPRIEEVAD